MDRGPLGDAKVGAGPLQAERALGPGARRTPGEDPGGIPQIIINRF